MSKQAMTFDSWWRQEIGEHLTAGKERAALAWKAAQGAIKQHDAEPVGWYDSRGVVEWNAGALANLKHRQPFYLSAPYIPEGWQLVPKEPKWEMLKAAWPLDGNDDDHAEIYRTMLSASPQPTNPIQSEKKWGE